MTLLKITDAIFRAFSRKSEKTALLFAGRSGFSGFCLTDWGYAARIRRIID
jgi:hypothetical protein